MIREGLLKGVLYLIPNTLGDESLKTISPEVARIVPTLRSFVVENAKSARKFLKLFELEVPLQELELRELPKDLSPSEISFFIAPLLAGENLGIISEAGCPCIADPGAELVREAHKQGMVVKPLVGPSSILLALIASGLSGQHFEFVGYLPREEGDLEKRIRDLESKAKLENKTIIFMETPYRSEKLFQKLLSVCNSATELTLARNLTLENQEIRTRSVAEYRKDSPRFEKDLTIFLMK